VRTVETITPPRLTIFDFHLWTSSFLPSSHDRSSPPFAVTLGYVLSRSSLCYNSPISPFISESSNLTFHYHCGVRVVKTTTPLHLTIFKFHLWPFSFLPSSHDRSSLPFAVTEGGLGTCCRGYHLATTHQSHQSFQGLFMTTILPRSIVPAFCCNSGVRAVEAITLLQLTNLTIHFRSFHDHHPATIEQPRLSL